MDAHTLDGQRFGVALSTNDLLVLGVDKTARNDQLALVATYGVISDRCGRETQATATTIIRHIISSSIVTVVGKRCGVGGGGGACCSSSLGRRR